MNEPERFSPYGKMNASPKSEPHQDAERNYHYCHELLRKIEILEKSLYWKIYDYEERGHDDDGHAIEITTNPKYILFVWEENGELWTGDRSFHMSHDEFKKQFVDAINFLLQKRFVKRFGVPIGTKKKSVTDQDHKYSALFDR